MKSINDIQNFDLEDIFGKEHVKRWEEAYPIAFFNEDIQKWIRDMISQYTDEGKDASKFNITTYLKPLEQYANFHDCKNPSKFLEEKIDDRNNRLKEYLHFLQNITEDEVKEFGFRKKPSDVSIRNQIQSRIKSFYSNRGVPISWGMKTRKSGLNLKELTLDKEMIKLIKNKLESTEYRLICKFSTQTGLRINDTLEELTSGKYIIEEYKEHYFIRNFETQKEKVIINFLFFTTELTQLLKSSTGIENILEIDLTTLLKTRIGNNIHEQNYLQRLKKIVKELKVKGNVKTHSFRKFFMTQIEECKEVDGKFKLVLTGHTLNFRDDAYNRNLTNIEWFYQNWLKIEQLICIDCIIQDNTDETVKDLKNQVENLRVINEEFQADKIKLEKEFEELRKTIPDLIQDEIKRLEERMLNRQKKMKGYKKQVEDLFEN